MDLDKKANEYNHYPSKYEMEYMSDYELFELASQNKKFRKMMVSCAKSFRIFCQSYHRYLIMKHQSSVFKQRKKRLPELPYSKS